MFPSQPSTDPALLSAIQRSIHHHWRAFLAEGILLSLLGLAAIVVPLLAGLIATVFLGWLFLVAGIAGLIFTIRAKQVPGYWWSLLSALIAIAAGGVLLWNPLASLVTLTYVLIVFFVVDGLLMIILAFAHRRELSGRWEWIMLNGVIDLVLAAIIIAGLPGTLVWALGLLVGIDLLFGGASLIAMALDAKKSAVP